MFSFISLFLSVFARHTLETLFSDVSCEERLFFLFLTENSPQAVSTVISFHVFQNSLVSKLSLFYSNRILTNAICNQISKKKIC